MRLKHYLLLALTVILIAFGQPFIVFLGNLLVICGALAYVYSDLSPEAQDAYEQKISDFFAGISNSLRSRGEARAEARLQKRSGIFRMLRRRKVTPSDPTVVIEDAIEAEISVPDKPTALSQASSKESSGSSSVTFYPPKAG